VLLNDDVIDDSESVDCNRDDECDDVGEGTKPNYAFIAVDSFSRFPFCVPLKSLHAKAVCEALLSIWQFTGVCSHLSTDLASNFVSQLTQQFEKMMGCSPIFNSPLNPQATGLAER